MGQLVDQGQPRVPVKNRGDVQLRKGRPPVADRAGGKYLKIGEVSSGRRPPVALPVGDERIGAAAPLGASVPEHRVGLAHARRNPEVGAQPALPGASAVPGPQAERPGSAGPPGHAQRRWLIAGSFQYGHRAATN